MSEISLDDLTQLKREYTKALKGGKESFMFKGTELLTLYAKYLIEYMTLIKNGNGKHN